MLKLTLILVSIVCLSCSHNINKTQMTEKTQKLKLPKPDLTHNVKNYSHVIGWKDKKPMAPKGFKVIKFASDLKNPRRMYELPNGHILVAEAESQFKNKKNEKEAISSGKIKSQNMGNSANQISILIDEDGDGVSDSRSVLLKNIRQPYGIAFLNGKLFVAATDGVWKYNYRLGDKKINSKDTKILNLPAGGYNNHWTRNLLISQDGKKLFVTVGSASNVAEYGLDEEKRRANILQVDLNGKNEVIYSYGLRNPVGIDFSETGDLWTVVNERDNIGDMLVPDYLTKVEEGSFYGWPFSYYGKNPDPRLNGQRPDLVEKTKIPDVALGSHTASLGLAFYKQDKFPKKYHWGAFIGQHGSWNRSEITGYQVAFVPFKNGKPAGPPEPFLTGFISQKDKSLVYGRPVGVEVLQDGSLLVSDDASNTIWLVKYTK